MDIFNELEQDIIMGFEQKPSHKLEHITIEMLNNMVPDSYEILYEYDNLMVIVSARPLM